jgi:hypothetical protein
MALSVEPDGGDPPTGTTSPPPTTAAALAVKLPAGTKTAVGLLVRDGDNMLRSIREGWVRTAAGLKQFFAGLSASLSAPTVNGARSSRFTVPVRTGSVTAKATGGAPPYTYSWTRIDGGAHAWTIETPSVAATRFNTLVAPSTTETATFACTVTDAAGTSVVSDDLTTNCVNS